MKTIILSKQLNGTSTNDDGRNLKNILMQYFINNEKVRISFKDTTPMSSSFFNSSFGDLINEFGIDKFRNIIQPVDIKLSHMNLIKKYISFYQEKISTI